MNKGLVKASYYLGVLIPFWLAMGVAVSGFLYPGYSQLTQAMSELGAVGSPTRYISPIINNYPLGVLFIIFGISVFNSFSGSSLSKTSGFLIVVHGVGSIFAGYFPCDEGCSPVAPSPTQVLHFSSGMVMFLSLMTAGLIWVYLAKKLLHSNKFAMFSLVCALAAVIAIPAMASAMNSGG